MRTKLMTNAKMSRKGVINIVELTIVVIILFVSFSIFFPRADYRNKWEDAYATLKSRDIILLLERTGNLRTYAFEPELIGNFFETLLPESNLIIWSETDGAIKKDIKIACNCTGDIITELTSWTNGLKLNERDITISFCSANLDYLGPCVEDSDVMLIWEYKVLQPYEQVLSDYIASSKGIVEVMDFRYQSEGNPVDDDSVQRNIFGLKWIDIEKAKVDYAEFEREPNNAIDIIFNPYKYFYNIPLPLEARNDGGTIEDCVYDPTKNGTFSFKSTNYTFWICNESSVWFDTNGDESYDRWVKERSEITIGGYTFLLNYVNSDSSISISFKPDYVFDDFLVYIAPPGEPDPPGKGWGVRRITYIEPIDDDTDRILMKSVSVSPPREYPCVILNQFGETGVAWVPDFSEDGFGDDEKLLLTSLLLWASNKRATSGEVSDIRLGYMTSYVNVENIDMFEVYKFSLGLGYPF